MSHLRREAEDEEERTFLEASQPVVSYVIGMVMKAAIELGIFDAMAIAGPEAQMTAGEIAGKLQLSGNEKAGSMLDRMLRFLASHSIVTSSPVAGRDDNSWNRYGLAPTSRLMAKSEDGLSLAPFFLLNHHKSLIDSWHYLKEAVQGGETPFARAHGATLYEHLAKNPGLGSLFNEAMESRSNPTMRFIVEKYKNGLMQINELVDVGGGTGASLGSIVAKFPHIRGINFDLPSVISQAPSIPGVEHVGGDMFDAIPSGQAILLKWIIHNWDDERCLVILRNCWKALPTSGKVIVVEHILPEAPESNLVAREAHSFDMIMMNLFDGAKERTEEEFRSLARKAGFSKFRVSCKCLSYHVMELVK